MTTRSRYRSGVLTFYEDIGNEKVLPLAPIVFSDDFLGQAAVAIPAAGSAVDGYAWVTKIVGSPTGIAGVANAVGGQVASALAATSEKEDSLLYWGDNLGLDVTKGLQFACRVNLSVLPSAASVQAIWGVQSVWIDGPNNNTCYLQFGATANGAILCRTYDGVTTLSLASGVTVTAGAWHDYRIDASDLTDVAFYIDGARVNANKSITPAFAATGTLAVLQPGLGVYKPSGTGVATLIVDYVRAWMNRQ